MPYLAAGCVALAVCLLLATQAPAALAAERILLFHSHVAVNPDASLTVTESIRVRCEGRQIRRGIVRDFPTSYKSGWGLPVRVGLEVLEVLRDGRPEPWHQKNVYNGVKIYMGRKGVLLSPGTYTYRLKYRTDRQLGHFADHDELYWNITGNAWTFPIDRAEAVIELPAGARVLKHGAYTGPRGARGQEFTRRAVSQTSIAFESTRVLHPGEGLTIVVAWPKGLVHPPGELQRLVSHIKSDTSNGVGLLWLVLLLGYYGLTWHLVGRDPRKGAIFPHYQPPAGLSPPAARYLAHMLYDDKALAAAMVDLAVQGCLVINNFNGDYTLQKGNRDPASAPPGERRLAHLLFTAGDTLALNSDNHAILQEVRAALKETLQKELDKIYFNTNVSYLGGGLFMSLAALWAMAGTSASWPHTAEPAFWLSIWTAVVLAGCFQIFRKWQGFLGRWWPVLTLLAAGGTLILSLAVLGESFSPVAVAIYAIILGINVVFFGLLRAFTLKGRQLMDQVEGFKLFLSVAEQPRLEILHPPEKTPELFEKYLPFALALDVENQWSQQFAEVLAQAGYVPQWYVGDSWDRHTPADFSSSLASSFTSSISSAATPPGSVSGFGDGGGSGGGGGGGGGSGW